MLQSHSVKPTIDMILRLCSNPILHSKGNFGFNSKSFSLVTLYEEGVVTLRNYPMKITLWKSRSEKPCEITGKHLRWCPYSVLFGNPQFNWKTMVRWMRYRYRRCLSHKDKKKGRHKQREDFECDYVNVGLLRFLFNHICVARY